MIKITGIIFACIYIYLIVLFFHLNLLFLNFVGKLNIIYAHSSFIVKDKIISGL